jgi:hypothetical protein
VRNQQHLFLMLNRHSGQLVPSAGAFTFKRLQEANDDIVLSNDRLDKYRVYIKGCCVAAKEFPSHNALIQSLDIWYRQERKETQAFLVATKLASMSDVPISLPEHAALLRHLVPHTVMLRSRATIALVQSSNPELVAATSLLRMHDATQCLLWPSTADCAALVDASMMQEAKEEEEEEEEEEGKQQQRQSKQTSESSSSTNDWHVTMLATKTAAVLKRLVFVAGSDTATCLRYLRFLARTRQRFASIDELLKGVELLVFLMRVQRFDVFWFLQDAESCTLLDRGSSSSGSGFGGRRGSSGVPHVSSAAVFDMLARMPRVSLSIAKTLHRLQRAQHEIQAIEMRRHFGSLAELSRAIQSALSGEQTPQQIMRDSSNGSLNDAAYDTRDATSFPVTSAFGTDPFIVEDDVDDAFVDLPESSPVQFRKTLNAHMRTSSLSWMRSFSDVHLDVSDDDKDDESVVGASTADAKASAATVVAKDSHGIHSSGTMPVEGIKADADENAKELLLAAAAAADNDSLLSFSKRSSSDETALSELKRAMGQVLGQQNQQQQQQQQQPPLPSDCKTPVLEEEKTTTTTAAAEDSLLLLVDTKRQPSGESSSSTISERVCQAEHRHEFISYLDNAKCSLFAELTDEQHITFTASDLDTLILACHFGDDGASAAQCVANCVCICRHFDWSLMRFESFAHLRDALLQFVPAVPSMLAEILKFSFANTEALLLSKVHKFKDGGPGVTIHNARRLFVQSGAGPRTIDYMQRAIEEFKARPAQPHFLNCFSFIMWIRAWVDADAVQREASQRAVISYISKRAAVFLRAGNDLQVDEEDTLKLLQVCNFDRKTALRHLAILCTESYRISSFQRMVNLVAHRVQKEQASLSSSLSEKKK